MNQQCKVCGEPAAGFHFGAFTCEGCKSFFGRTYNNLSSISECKNGGVCVINKKNRTACKACRLRKCLVVGMSKSGSRYGRRSNWFKIHCLLQEQTHNHASASPFPAGYMSSFMPSQNPVDGSLKEKEIASASDENLNIHRHLLQMAMINKEFDRTKSPHPDDIALQQRLRMLAWQRDQERLTHQQQHQGPGTPPRETSPPSSYNYKTSAVAPCLVYPKDTSPPGVFRPFSFKRAADTPSDSGASSIDGESCSESDYYKNLSPVKSIPTVAAFPRHPLQLVYSSGSFVTTPVASQPSPRGGDLNLVSPSPGGVAVEQDQPIDLSVKCSRSSPRPVESPVEHLQVDDHPETSHNAGEETATKGKPLDLTLAVKRPELPVSL
ncbi:uncharacterized protein LOC141535104 [Cotesia typhae]|uniref:uncharacterized protein LOC141535104 n=1 Tax=Cotesia typhae TaxID=2053667 RepID=UPI003D68A7B0